MYSYRRLSKKNKVLPCCVTKSLEKNDFDLFSGLQNSKMPFWNYILTNQLSFSGSSFSTTKTFTTNQNHTVYAKSQHACKLRKSPHESQSTLSNIPRCFHILTCYLEFMKFTLKSFKVWKNCFWKQKYQSDDS